MQISTSNNMNFKGLFGQKTEYSTGKGNVTHSHVTHHYYPFCDQTQKSINYATRLKTGTYTYYPDQTGGEFYIEHNKCKIEKTLPFTSIQFSRYKKWKPLNPNIVAFIENILIENDLLHWLRKAKKI